MDKRQIGLTEAMQGISEELLRSGLFENAIFAARFAMALAIGEGVRSGRAEGANTKWHTGDLDPEGEMKAVVGALYPECEDEPYRQVEHLINEGLRIIGERTRTEPYDDDVLMRRLPDVIKLLEGLSDKQTA